MIRIAIVGSRDYPRIDLVARWVHACRISFQLVSGGARGVDRAAEIAWRDRFDGEPLVFEPLWSQYGPKLAPIIRNTEIARSCAVLVAFWDGQSTGTADVITKARQLRRQVIVYGADGGRGYED